MIRLVVFFTLLCGFSLSSRSQVREETTEIFYWDESGCADYWGDSVEGESVVTIISRYLKTKGVTILKFSIDFDTSKVEYCMACHCKTGRVYSVVVPASEKSKMRDLHFYHEEDFRTYSWDESKCSGRWEQGKTSNDQKRIITQFLKDRGVEVEEIYIGFNRDKKQLCKACHCRTGNVITVITSEKQDEKLKDLMFYKIGRER